MKQKTLRITEKDFLLANRRASRNEEIEKFGKQVLMRTLTHKSKKVYDRNRLKRAAIKNDDSSFYLMAIIICQEEYFHSFSTFDSLSYP